MKKLLSILLLIVLFSCESKKIEPTQFECSFQMTTLLLPVGNSTTKQVRGMYTSEEIVQLLNSNYDMYLINCVRK